MYKFPVIEMQVWGLIPFIILIFSVAILIAITVGWTTLSVNNRWRQNIKGHLPEVYQREISKVEGEVLELTSTLQIQTRELQKLREFRKAVGSLVYMEASK